MTQSGSQTLQQYFSSYVQSQRSSQRGRSDHVVGLNNFGTNTTKYCVYEIIITPEQGGLEAQDFARLLQSAYLKYCQRENIKVIRDSGQPHAYLIEVKVSADSKFPMCEHGLHKMTRASPYGNGKIHTSHAKVIVQEKISIPAPILSEGEITYEPFKAPGPGGQHKNKTMSAIRATHKNGLTVLAVHSRSQHENRAQALTQMREKWAELFATFMREQSQNKWAQRKQLELVRTYLDNHNYVVWDNGNKTRFQDFFKGIMSF